jgi:hypothetical protein
MTKFYILLLITGFFAGIENIFSQTPAFPGAEGYGKYVTGGRGGRVVYVTHLKDATDTKTAGYKGSLRAALSTSGSDPIIIMFKCGGTIALSSSIACSRNNVTLAGQSALGDGVCVNGYGISFSGENIIVRYMRFRVSDRINQNTPALTFSNGKNAIIDHCSFSWSVEENVNITDEDSITLQWCINSESLYNSIHTKGSRAYAAQWGGEHASYHHNLLAHHHSRMPRNNGNTSNDYQLTWDYRNNVHYNWGSYGAFYGGGVEQVGGYVHSNLINNYYIPGPETKAESPSSSKWYFCAPSGGRVSGFEYTYGYGQWYLSGNVMVGNSGYTSNNYSGVYLNDTLKRSNFFPTDSFTAAPVSTTSAVVAYEEVLAGAGATRPKRDSIDTRIVKETQNVTATYGGILGAGLGIIDSDRDLMPSSYDTASTDDRLKWIKALYTTTYNGTTNYSTYSVTDTDNDGMPDSWETTNGLNPADSIDGPAYSTTGNGYTNLEVYLNGLSLTPVKETSAEPVVEIIPNPVTTAFKINSVLSPKTIELYNTVGVKEKTFNNNENNSYSISQFSDGIYLLKIEFSNGTTLTRKILIRKN